MADKIRSFTRLLWLEAERLLSNAAAEPPRMPAAGAP